MFTPQPQTPPPDWETLKSDLKCPLCDYNLRGLIEPRCPECGFKFTWQELLDAEQNRHPYLFEYYPNRNFWSFWKTFWGDRLPSRFWQELSPAHAIRVKRLIIYWLLANGLFLLPIIAPLINNGFAVVQRNADIARRFTPIPNTTLYQYTLGPRGMRITSAQYQRLIVPVWSWDFVRATLALRFLNSSIDPSVVEFLLWPWLTLLSLLIFQISMRRAKIKSSHVFRCAIYGCDFGVLAAVLFGIISLLTGRLDDSTPFFLLMIFPLVATYRLMFAYKWYLRFSQPFLTVAVSQFVVFLAMLDVLMNWKQLTHGW